jgi:hypothetical protein
MSHLSLQTRAHDLATGHAKTAWNGCQAVFRGQQPTAYAGAKKPKQLTPRHKGAKKREAQVLAFLCELRVLCDFA